MPTWDLYRFAGNAQAEFEDYFTKINLQRMIFICLLNFFALFYNLPSGKVLFTFLLV